VSGRAYTVALPTGNGTGPELIAAASRALGAVSRLHGFHVVEMHAPIGADALSRVGTTMPLGTRGACLDADAVLLAETTGAGELLEELDLRARTTRVRFGALGDVLLLEPLADAAAEWTVDRAFAAAEARRLRLATVGSGGAWNALVESVARRYEDVAVERLEPSRALALLAFHGERFDVVVSGPTFGEALASLVGAASIHRRVSAFGLLAGHGPGVFGPSDAGSSAIAGQGVVNPSSMLLAVALMLCEGLGERAAGATLAGAVVEAMGNGAPTPDLLQAGVGATTREFTDAVVGGFQMMMPNAEFARELAP
jgi:isocitrate/isopropylmalate dehydrogenase